MRSLIVLMALAGTASLAQEQADEAPTELEPTAETSAEDSTEDNGETGAEGGVRSMLGMSILGNEEAPKALVIVPWKSSQIGEGMGVTNSMDDRARPVDREVFMRELRYYELRSGASEQ